MSAATMTETVELSISEIEDKLAELGYETEYYGDDDRTEFNIRIGDKEITIVDGVSGEFFRPEHVTYASYFFGDIGKDQTEQFAEADTVDMFIYRVQDVMSVSFMPR
jgi:hypothetical protein